MWWVALAVAAVPEGVRPVVMAAAAPARYASWRAERGLAPAELPCTAAGPPGILVCFRVWENGQRRWVHREDLAQWGTSVAELRASMEERAVAQLADLRTKAVTGTSERYLELADGDGWTAAGVLRPDVVAARLGGGAIRIAVPSQGVLVAFSSRGEELDHIMAVGVREMFHQLRQPVSPMVFGWHNGTWRAWGQALAPEP